MATLPCKEYRHPEEKTVNKMVKSVIDIFQALYGHVTHLSCRLFDFTTCFCMASRFSIMGEGFRSKWVYQLVWFVVFNKLFIDKSFFFIDNC